MPGIHVTDRQVRRYMSSRKDGYSQAAAAARAVCRKASSSEPVPVRRPVPVRSSGPVQRAELLQRPAAPRRDSG